MIWAFCGKIGGVGKSIGAATCIERLATLGEFAVVEADVNNNVGAYADPVAKKVGAAPKVRFSAASIPSYGHRWASARWLVNA